MSSPDSFLFHFMDEYHLWSWVLLLSLFGVYHFVTVAVWHWFRLLGEVNEAYYCYKTRCVENRRRYEQLTAESGSVHHSQDVIPPT